MDTLYLVMPAYNEEANIEEVVSQWHAICEKINAEGNAAKLVIANDGSKDNTGKVLERLQRTYPYLQALNKPNSGHGATVLHLYRYAIEHGEPGDIVILAGKGHEDYQEIKGKKYPMDERVIIADILKERGIQV